MTRPMIRIHNTETNEIVDREMNDQEYAYHLQIVADVEADKKEIVNKLAARQAVLDKLGLTVDEIATLGL